MYCRTGGREEVEEDGGEAREGRGRTEGTVDLGALDAVSLSISWNRHVYLNGYLKECNDIRECVCVCLGEGTKKEKSSLNVRSL